jgi:hypothetical protein
MGHLDVRALCTARLVCRQFCQCASAHVKALQLDCTDLEQPPTISLTRLSGLTHLAVSIHKGHRLRLLAQARIAPLVTHVQVGWDCMRDMGREEACSHFMHLPMLQSLVLPVWRCNFELLPLTLEELQLPYLVEKDASSLTRLSRLTNLVIDLSGLLTRTGNHWEAGQSLGTLASLHNLRSLTLCCGSSASGALSRFTMLTSLAWDMAYDDKNPRDLFPELAHLTGLSRLTLSNIRWWVRHEDLACLSPLTKLTFLGFKECDLHDDVEGSRALVPLTSLVSVQMSSVTDGKLLLPALKVESLQSLSLWCVAGDISVVQRATGLTHLQFHCFSASQSLFGLEETLARMSKLRSLSLTISELAKPPEGFHLSTVLRALTSLTKLRYCGNFRVGTDMSACAALPGLVSLELKTHEVTPACLPALQAMSGLTHLNVRHTGIYWKDLTPEVIAAFNSERDRRGWPGLRFVC